MSLGNSLIGANKLILVGLFIALAVFWFLRKPQSVLPPTDEWFQAEVTNEARPVLVKFGADWCGPCRLMDESIKQVAPAWDQQIKFVKIDVDKNPALASHYRISGIPRTFIFHHGKIIADQIGPLDAERLKSWIQTTLAAIPDELSYSHRP